jgi:hypothetical protein
VEVGHLKTSESEVIQLVWREIGGEEQDGYETENILFYPNSTWTEGRNRLFREIQIRFPDVEFQYTVFLDDDVVLEEVEDYGMNTGNAWRTFEKYLVEWEPAVGVPSYHKTDSRTLPETEVVSIFDQIVVAFHWETWAVLLPYTEVFDEQSWWYCAVVQSVLCTVFFSNRIQFNAVTALNVLHRQSEIQSGVRIYRRNTNFGIPREWISSALTDLSTIYRLNLSAYESYDDSPPRKARTWGTPQKRLKEQDVSAWFINPSIDFQNLKIKDPFPEMVFNLKYDQDHPYFVGRKLLEIHGTCDVVDTADDFCSGISLSEFPATSQRLNDKIHSAGFHLEKLKTSVEWIDYTNRSSLFEIDIDGQEEHTDRPHQPQYPTVLDERRRFSEGCAIISPLNRSTLHVSEDMVTDEDYHLLKVTCWVEEHMRWKRDACHVVLQVDGERGAGEPLIWSDAKTVVGVEGSTRAVFFMEWAIRNNFVGYHTYKVGLECEGSEKGADTVAVLFHQPDLASPKECVPHISLPAGQDTHWLPSLHYLSVLSNQLITEYSVNVSIEVKGCVSDNKFQAFYYNADNAGKFWGKAIGKSDDARDPVSLLFPGLGLYDLVVELVSTDGLNRVVSAGLITLQLLHLRSISYVLLRRALHVNGQAPPLLYPELDPELDPPQSLIEAGFTCSALSSCSIYPESILGLFRMETLFPSAPQPSAHSHSCVGLLVSIQATWRLQIRRFAILSSLARDFFSSFERLFLFGQDRPGFQFRDEHRH